ncbi:YidC/Oxa1 family membrane protein insertase [Phytohabitans rumicis]|uniref:Membrane protein insertase YidC n=1 Tax=Phytohabitans rumicis TaxID=1076125 RepID=A0A6V8LCU1_9ACTN|nr:membrane protein insertase YidC [Phytohabitans rumicis]GFJ90495.1 protein translocase component YidC [Phytohabitans rumicis]
MLAFAPINGAAGAAYHVVTGLADLIAPLAGTTATAAAIVLFTMLVRLLISPLSWAQIRGQQRQATLAPKLRELQERHRNDPARLRTELATVYREAGTTPLSGCLPALLQAPFFFVMYRLFTTSTINGEGNSLLAERLLGVPLGQHFADGLGGGAGLVFLALFAALAALAWLTSRRMRRAAVPADGPAAAISRVLPLLPFTVLIAAAVMPLAAGLYLVTTTAWTALEQGVLRRFVVVPAG